MVFRESEASHESRSFFLSRRALSALETLKQELVKSSLGCINKDVPFEFETNASDHFIAAVLSQNGGPVEFISRTSNQCERKHPAMEKETTAIIEAVRKWAHFLEERAFTLSTDQRSISSMFHKKNHGKIKNKIMVCRL